MSYAVSASLQAAIYQRLSSDDALAALVGSDIYDAPPAGTLPSLYVTLGAETARDASDATGRGAWHDLTVAVVTDAAGFQIAKTVAAAACDALADVDPALDRGRLVSLRFLKARAKRESGGLRRIDMIFRARVEDD
ncbi:MAG: DUF3168 domain-containing protein [Rhodobacteraceae bacterium]|jgi:hypothetical protein|uniref:Putative DUF3168 protein n=1 Tax=Salipiger profundus TaxID=1229727 RepID=A0A1U7D014_9RHOB|nr:MULTISPECIES: DUF3168 domain-containing protein [Salipiger]APX21416.1 putative DUF3168 protein [Salipiger profundus]MAB08826.1 DUF3168 domain-containing protein [Paracoccaceae bacterium]GGA02527.1 hypothetical protein GCM10011326_12340 [Salipiger profundus]SFC21750.1 Protein of unknown function [Salipiger profundus]